MKDSECAKQQDCSLHLNSLSSFGVGPITTAESAPGLIIATGNEGTHLEVSHADTYLSVDAGLSFKKILSGSHIYQVGDQGALIVAASDDKAVTTVKFSWNGGKGW